MTELLDNIFAIEVELDANTFEYNQKWSALAWYTGRPGFENIRTMNVFDGPYEILFTTKDCTDEQAAKIPMEDSEKNFGYKDYEGKESAHFHAHLALQSLLKSKGLTAENYLIIKRVEG